MPSVIAARAAARSVSGAAARGRAVQSTSPAGRTFGSARATNTQRGYANDASRTGISAVNYTDDPRGGAPGRPPRRLGRRLLFYTLFSTLAFYGGSAYVAQHSERYADWLSQNVPLGESLVQYLESHDLDAEVSEGARSALSLSKRAYESVSSTISGVTSSSSADARTAIAEGEKDARQMLAEARDRAAREGRKAKLEAKSQIKDGREAVSETAASLKQRAESLVDQAKEAAQRAEESLRSGLGSAKDAVQDAGAKAKDAADRATAGVAQKLPEGVKVYVGNEPNKADAPAVTGTRDGALVTGPGGAAKATTAAPPAAAWSEPLPVSFEPPPGYVAPRKERPLQPPSDAEPGVALRADPGAPKLPKLASAISRLGGAASTEPVVAQLAETIDDLAAFLKDAPASSSFQAKEVLNLAQADLEKLTDRLEAIKRKEADRVDRTLKAQQAKYERELEAAEQKAQAMLGQKDQEWHANLAKEREQQRKDYLAKLEKELSTQSELINERLREEIIAQGIELQRRWMRDIKARVEQERGGRLARLDELATQVQHLESVARENARDLDQSNSNNTLLATVRALQRILDTPGAALEDGEDASEGEAALAGKKPFRAELRKLRNSAAVADSPVITAALDYLDKSKVPDEGVDTFLTLNAWFHDKVGPAILRTSLLPDSHNGSSAGVLSHVTSAVLSPLLFRKRGLVQGTDVPSILSRAEYYLQREDLDGAAREVNQLKGWGKVLAEDWLDAARKRLEAKQALEVIALEANYKTLVHA